MWFVYVFVGLGLLVPTCIYVRHHLTRALRRFGTGERAIRIMRWALVWLLFGYPLILIATVLGSVVLHRDSLIQLDGLVPSIVLAVPFIFTVLICLQAIPWLLAIDLFLRRRERARTIAAMVVLGAFTIYTPARVLIERDTIRERTFRVGNGTGEPFRIGFLGDIQEDDFTDGDRAREVYARLNAHAPDIILSAGDWINTGPKHVEEAAAAAETLRSPLGTWSVRGDHEHFAFVDRERSAETVTRALARHHVTMLANEVRTFDHAGKKIAIAFLNYNYIVRSTPAQVDALLEQLRGADYRILVTHQFDRALAAQVENRVDLVLAGHTHGGQVNPVLGLVHVKLARLETRFIDGEYELGTTKVIVTSGVGTSVVPIRYAAPGSIELIELR